MTLLSTQVSFGRQRFSRLTPTIQSGLGLILLTRDRRCLVASTLNTAKVLPTTLDRCSSPAGNYGNNVLEIFTINLWLWWHFWYSCSISSCQSPASSSDQSPPTFVEQVKTVLRTSTDHSQCCGWLRSCERRQSATHWMENPWDACVVTRDLQRWPHTWLHCRLCRVQQVEEQPWDCRLHIFDMSELKHNYILSNSLILIINLRHPWTSNHSSPPPSPSVECSRCPAPELSSRPDQWIFCYCVIREASDNSINSFLIVTIRPSSQTFNKDFLPQYMSLNTFVIFFLSVGKEYFPQLSSEDKPGLLPSAALTWPWPRDYTCERTWTWHHLASTETVPDHEPDNIWWKIFKVMNSKPRCLADLIPPQPWSQWIWLSLAQDLLRPSSHQTETLCKLVLE